MIVEKSKHYRAIKLKFMPATDYKCSRIKLTDERFEQSKTIGVNYKYDNILEQAIDYLIDKGFNVIGHGGMKYHYIVFCDNWGDKCIKLKEIK